MDLKLDDALIRQMLKDKVLNPKLQERDEVLELFMHLFDSNGRELKQLMYLLLGIKAVINYKIGDKVRVKIKVIHSWNAEPTRLRTAVENAADSDDCIVGTITNIDEYSDAPYSVAFHYKYKSDTGTELGKDFDQTLSEKDFFDKKSSAKPLLDL